jgi:hypothetical protein
MQYVRLVAASDADAPSSTTHSHAHLNMGMSMVSGPGGLRGSTALDRSLSPDSSHLGGSGGNSHRTRDSVFRKIFMR